MRSTNTVDYRAAHEIWVVRTQHDLARVLVDVVSAVEIAVDGGGEQARDVGVVHDIHGAVAIDLVDVDAAVVRVVADAVCANSVLKRPRKAVHLVCKVALAAKLLDDFGGGGEVAGEHHVGGDEELVDRCVVRGAEGGADKAGAALGGVAETVILEGFGGAVGGAAEGIGACVDAAVGGVGWGHHGFGNGHDGFDGVDPLVFSKKGYVFSCGIVVGGDLQESC